MRIVGTLLVAALLGLRAQSQELRPVSRAEAVSAALTAGSRARIALTDTAIANALARVASAYPNPALAAGYSKATPQYHLSLDQPIEYPWLRSARAGAATEFRRAALYRYIIERASAEVEADTTYTAVLAARAHALLSHLTAVGAESLSTLARLRRDAGDASDLEVELAAVNAGQAANVSAADSLAAIQALLELQRTMGLAGDRPLIALVDSLTTLPAVDGPRHADSAAAPLAIAAAEASAHGAERVLAAESRSVFATPTVIVGFDTHDPSGAEPGTLPVFGISLPLPLWNQRGGEVAVARAGLTRAQEELAQARRESDAHIARARRELTAALARVTRDQRLLASARRVAAMALTAYAEGAAGLPTVLEAQRTARDAFGRYVDDLAAAQNAAAILRLHTLTATAP